MATQLGGSEGCYWVRDRDSEAGGRGTGGVRSAGIEREGMAQIGR
jgi:hypothetical protein